MEENDEGEPIGIEFTNQIAGPENNKNAIGFRCSDVQGEDEEDIAKADIIENLQKRTDERNFHNKLTGGFFEYNGILHKVKKKLKTIYLKKI